MTAQPFYLEAAGDSILAFVHPPAADRWSGTGVVIVPPFGWDEVASYRPRRAWAGALAAAGHAAVRIDLPGTGDSGGSPSDPDRLGAWTAAVTAASGWLRESGARRVCAIGIGLGASITMRAVSEGAPITDVVLWSVSSSGRRLVRGLRAFAALQENPGTEFAPGGYILTPETTEALEALDLMALDLGDERGRRALLLGRDRPLRDADLERHLASAGFAVTSEAGHGYAAMTAAPDGARLPRELIDLVDGWLPREEAGGSFSPTRVPQAAVLRGEEGVPIRETALTFAVGDATLFGVLAEPPEPGSAITAVLLNAGAIHRTGPNRMWVETARRWAARGVPTLRLDVEGIGDASGNDARDADVSLYVPAYTQQVFAVLDQLSARGLPSRFALGGLCSGAYWALHAALDDERVVAALMLNPRLLVWDAELVRAREARRVLAQAQGPAWRRAVRGRWTPRRLARLGATLARALWTRLSQRRIAEADVSPAIERVARSPARFVIGFSGDEPLREELERDGLLAALEALGNVEVVSLAGADHTLRPLAAQRSGHEALDRGIETLLT